MLSVDSQSLCLAMPTLHRQVGPSFAGGQQLTLQAAAIGPPYLLQELLASAATFRYTMQAPPEAIFKIQNHSCQERKLDRHSNKGKVMRKIHPP